jgi:hypothetical protein
VPKKNLLARVPLRSIIIISTGQNCQQPDSDASSSQTGPVNILLISHRQTQFGSDKVCTVRRRKFEKRHSQNHQPPRPASPPKPPRPSYQQATNRRTQSARATLALNPSRRIRRSKATCSLIRALPGARFDPSVRAPLSAVPSCGRRPLLWMPARSSSSPLPGALHTRPSARTLERSNPIQRPASLAGAHENTAKRTSSVGSLRTLWLKSWGGQRTSPPDLLTPSDSQTLFLSKPRSDSEPRGAQRKPRGAWPPKRRGSSASISWARMQRMSPLWGSRGAAQSEPS